MKKSKIYRQVSFKPTLLSLSLLISIFFIIISTANAAVTQTAVVATAAADYSSGAHSVISVDPVGGPRTVLNDIAATISDITVVANGEYFYRIEKYSADNVTKFHIDTPNIPIWQYSTLDANDDVTSNPYDLIFLNDNKAYLLRYGATKAWIVNPSATTEAEFKIGELDLSSYKDDDGIPEMNSGVIVNGKLFITCQRLDQNDNWTGRQAYVAVFDTGTDTEIDTGIENQDGVLGIPVPVTNLGAIQYLGENDTIYVQGTGQLESSWSGTPAVYSSGIVSINPNTYITNMVMDDGDDENHPYGNISGMAIVSATKGYFVGYAGWGDNTLYSFNPLTGVVNGAVTGFENKNIAGMESGVYTDNNNMLWICNQTDAKVDILNINNDTIDESIPTNLNPVKVVFCETSSAGSPTPNIKVNGSDGPITLSTNDTISVTISLNANGYTDQNADWWVTADTPFAQCYYDVINGWLQGLSFAYQGPLFDFSFDFEILSLSCSWLPAGDYTFCFSIDDNADGAQDSTWSDHVEVRIEE